MIKVEKPETKPQSLYKDNPASRALYQRFMDLPRSEREEMTNELHNAGDYWHFKTYLCDRGNSLANAKASVVSLVGRYLGVSVEQMARNSVDFVPYAVFSQNRAIA
ncbi:hypothetical protein [Spirosoma daeguense]